MIQFAQALHMPYRQKDCKETLKKDFFLVRGENSVYFVTVY